MAKQMLTARLCCVWTFMRTLAESGTLVLPRDTFSGRAVAAVGAELVLWCLQVYKAMRRHVQECAVKILRNVNEDELTNFQRVSQLLTCIHACLSCNYA